MPCTSDGSCGTRTRPCLRESSIDFVEIDQFLLVAGSQERIGTGFRQHAIDDHAADRHAGFLQLLDGARGLFDRQPLGDQHQHEGADPRAQQPGAELAQVFEAFGQRDQYRILRIILVDAHHRLSRLRQRADPCFHQLRHANQPQGVAGWRRVEHDQVEAIVLAANQAADAIEQRHLLGARHARGQIDLP